MQFSIKEHRKSDRVNKEMSDGYREQPRNTCKSPMRTHPASKGREFTLPDRVQLGGGGARKHWDKIGSQTIREREELKQPRTHSERIQQRQLKPWEAWSRYENVRESDNEAWEQLESQREGQRGTEGLSEAKRYQQPDSVFEPERRKKTAVAGSSAQSECKSDLPYERRQPWRYGNRHTRSHYLEAENIPSSGFKNPRRKRFYLPDKAEVFCSHCKLTAPCETPSRALQSSSAGLQKRSLNRQRNSLNYPTSRANQELSYILKYQQGQCPEKLNSRIHGNSQRDTSSKEERNVLSDEVNQPFSHVTAEVQNEPSSQPELMEYQNAEENDMPELMDCSLTLIEPEFSLR